MHDTADWHRDLSPQDRDASSLGSESGLQSGGGGGEVHVSLQVDRRGEGFHAEDVQVVALTKSTDVRSEIPKAQQSHRFWKLEQRLRCAFAGPDGQRGK